CMFGGMLARVVWNHLGFSISRSIIELIGAASLSVLIATAIGTMSLEYISTHIGIFLILAATGIIWILAAFILFAPRMFKRHWFQNGIVNMAQSMGQTATGLLFVKMVDPKDKTEAMESFGYKQLLFEPFVGGGIITALSMPAIILLGLPTFTIIASVVCIAWLLIGLFYFSKL
ncbi:sodium:glutamate symporter, partial [Candidatus Saccharibacteria bacterium]|nr:sodium:glutamate symporter [Candidatus Saccharibacteria bacterium]